MAASGKICQNIPGIESKMSDLTKVTDNFLEKTPFLGDSDSSLIKVEKECQGIAYGSIKDNDEETYEILKCWCDLSDQLVAFLQSDVDTLKEADGSN